MKLFLCGLLVLAALSVPLYAGASLKPGDAVELAGTKGKFDFLKVDAANRRLLACHTGNGSLDVIDLDHPTLIKSIPTGAAQGVAVDEKGGRYFVSCSKPAKLVIVDSAKLEVTGEVDLPGPADLCAYDGASRVFVDNDEKPEMWTILVAEKQIIKTRTLEGAGLEDLGIDDGGYLVQAIKDASLIVRIPTQLPADGDMSKAQLLQWPTAPAEKPHGIALLKNGTVLIAGAGKLALMNYNDGKILASCDIAPKVDQIAYDPDLGRVYCASGTGVISAVFVAENKLTPLGDTPSEKGAHSIAVDPKSHTVWIAYAKGDKAFVQSFTEQ